MEEEKILQLAFEFGQNEVQPRKCLSVAVGDVIRLDGKRHMIMPDGFRQLTESEYNHHKSLPRFEKQLNPYKLQRGN